MQLNGPLSARRNEIGNTLRIDMGNTFHVNSIGFHGHVVETNSLFGATASVRKVGIEGPTKHVAVVSVVQHQSSDRVQAATTIRGRGRSGAPAPGQRPTPTP